MLLDEITSGVDAIAREQLWALIKKICHDKTIVATTHTLHEAQIYFDRIAFIMRGKIVCTGTTDSILECCKNKISIEVCGTLPKDFFDKAEQRKINVQDTQIEGRRIQQLEAVCSNNIESLFELLTEYEKAGVISSFTIN